MLRAIGISFLTVSMDDDLSTRPGINRAAYALLEMRPDERGRKDKR